MGGGSLEGAYATFALGKCVKEHWKVRKPHLHLANVLNSTGRCVRHICLWQMCLKANVFWSTGRSEAIPKLAIHLPKLLDPFLLQASIHCAS